MFVGLTQPGLRAWEGCLPTSHTWEPPLCGRMQNLTVLKDLKKDLGCWEGWGRRGTEGHRGSQVPSSPPRESSHREGLLETLPSGIGGCWGRAQATESVGTRPGPYLAL